MCLGTYVCKKNETILSKNVTMCKVDTTFSIAVCSNFVPFSAFLFVFGIVVPGRPAWIQLPMHLPLTFGQVIVFSLFIFGQGMPL